MHEIRCLGVFHSPTDWVLCCSACFSLRKTDSNRNDNNQQPCHNSMHILRPTEMLPIFSPTASFCQMKHLTSTFNRNAHSNTLQGYINFASGRIPVKCFNKSVSWLVKYNESKCYQMKLFRIKFNIVLS